MGEATQGVSSGRGEGIGERVVRREDAALLTGRARFIDDLDLPGQVHAYFLRSPHAHARIEDIDLAAAAGLAGVVAVFTGADIQADGFGRVQAPAALKGKDGAPIHNPPQFAITADKARYVGDTVAMVLAETLAQAQIGRAHV